MVNKTHTDHRDWAQDQKINTDQKTLLPNHQEENGWASKKHLGTAETVEGPYGGTISKKIHASINLNNNGVWWAPLANHPYFLRNKLLMSHPTVGALGFSY